MTRDPPDQLLRWLPTAEARGFRLVPVSAIVQHNETLAGHAQRGPAQDCSGLSSATAAKPDLSGWEWTRLDGWTAQ